MADSAPLFPLIQAATRRDYAIRDTTGTLMADSASRIDQSCTRCASDYLPGLPGNERRPIPGSGHHGDRPSSRLNQPHGQRTDQPVTGVGRRPHHHGIGTDALSHAAQLSEGVAAGGDEGDGNAQLPEDLLNPAARFLAASQGKPPGAARPSASAPPTAGQRKQRSPWPLAGAPGQPHTSQPAPRSPIHRCRRESTWRRRFPVRTGRLYLTAQQECGNQAAQPPRHRRCLIG